MVLKKLILLELNEVNFDLIKLYVESCPNEFPHFCELFKRYNISTVSELEYSSLEPWIQWVSVHTGLKLVEHNIFRLGDIVNSPKTQIFEMIESAGYSVGCISPMNTDNRLKNAAYFLPDPWTKTRTDSSWPLKKMSQAISQAVNDNSSGHISLVNLGYLIFGFLRFFRFKYLYLYLAIGYGALRSKWNKALFLDLLLHDIHLKLLLKTNPNFSTIFFNAGAHIQHHYLLNTPELDESKKTINRIRNPEWYISRHEDPVREVYKLYDFIIGDYLQMKNIELLVATGLSQVKYDVCKYYYRLKNHVDFLSKLGITFQKVYPRMTRDFLIEFSSREETQIALKKLKSLFIGETGIQLFGEIDDRGLSLFVTLSYPNEILPGSSVKSDNDEFDIYPHLAFVALKNGKHHCKGYAFFSDGLVEHAPLSGSHVCEIFNVVKSYFIHKSKA